MLTAGLVAVGALLAWALAATAAAALLGTVIRLAERCRGFIA